MRRKCIIAGIFLMLLIAPVVVSVSLGSAGEEKNNLEMNKYNFMYENGEITVHFNSLSRVAIRHDVDRCYVELYRLKHNVTLILSDVKDVSVNLNRVQLGKYEIRSVVNLSSYKRFICTEGGIELNVTFDRPSVKNIITIPFEYSPDLHFYYQPPLTEEYNASEYDFVNETIVMKDGEVVAYRPPDVVGSYAVYCDKTGIKDGVNYRAGKIMHIYRPKVIDANGRSAWCNLSIEKGVLKILMPEEFMRTAVYPVTLDPIFGYDSVGGSGIGVRHIARGTLFDVPSSGIAKNISVYIEVYTSGFPPYTGSTWVETGIYDSTRHLKRKTERFYINDSTFPAQWKTLNLESDYELTDSSYFLIILLHYEDEFRIDCFYDHASMDSFRSNSTYTSLPTLINDYTHENRIYSIYCTYEEPPNESPVLSNESPSNGTVNVDISLSQLSVEISDPEGNLMDWSIETSPNVGSASGNDADNGTITCSISGLNYGTEYIWYVNVTDGNSWTNETYSFITREQYVPDSPSSFTAIATSSSEIDLSWTKGNNADTTYIERNTVTSWNRGEGTLVYNGTGSSFSDTGLNPHTTYYYQAWSYNVTDNVYSTSYSSVSVTTLNNEPLVSNECPLNGSVDVELVPLCHVDVSDADGDSLTVYWYENSTGSWVLRQTNSSVASGSVYWTYEQADVYSTTYYWKVAVNDGFSNVSKIYHFTTREQYIPEDPSNFNAIAVNRFQIDLTWNKGTNADYTRIEYSFENDESWTIGGHSLLYNGSGDSVSHTGLNPGTTVYYKAWSYNATDKTWSDGITLYATTEENQAPVQTSEYPLNGSMNVDISLGELKINLSDPEGDPLNWTIETCPDVGSASGTGDSNGTKTCTIDVLNYNTTYIWYVNVTDGYVWNNQTYTFTTKPPAILCAHPDGEEVPIELNGVLTSLNLTVSAENMTWYWSIDNVTWTEYAHWTNVGEGHYSAWIDERLYPDVTYYWKVVLELADGWENYTYSFTTSYYNFTLHNMTFKSNGKLHYSRGNLWSTDFFAARNYSATGYKSGTSTYSEYCGIYYDASSGFKFYRLKITYPLEGLPENISFYGGKVRMYITATYSPSPRNWSLVLQSGSASDGHVYQPIYFWSYAPEIEEWAYKGDYCLYLNTMGAENLTSASSMSFWYRVSSDVLMQNMSKKMYVDVQAKSQYNALTLYYNFKPEIVSVNPVNGTKHVNLQPTITIDVRDLENDSLTVRWYENTSGSWVLCQTNEGLHNESVNWTYENATEYNHTYYFKVVVSDAFGERSYVYHFTTRCLPNTPVNVAPPHGAVNYTITPSFSVYCSDPENDSMTVRFYWANDTLIGSTTLKGNGTAMISPSLRLIYSTLYQWYVKVNTTEGTVQSPVWNFTTREDVPPAEPRNVRPYNHSRTVDPTSSIMLQAYIPSDPDGDTIQVIFRDDTNNVTILNYIGSGGELLNVSLTPWYLNWSTRMNWSIHIYDGFKWTNRSYWFITQKEPETFSMFLGKHVKELIALIISLALWIFFIYVVVTARYRNEIENLLFGIGILGTGVAISASTLLMSFTVTGGLISSVILAISVYFALKYSLLMFRR